MPDLRAMTTTNARSLRPDLSALRIPAASRGRVTAAATVAALLLGVVLASRYEQWPYVINGISDGSIYAMAAVGLVLTYKTSGVFNFAIGAQAAASAYVFHSLRDTLGWPWPPAALVTVLVVSVVSTFVLERIGFWLGQAPAIMRVVASIGLLVLLDSLLVAIYGAATIPFTQYLPTASFRTAGITIAANQIIVTVLALGATVGLYVFFRRSRWGIAMQAVVDDAGLLSLQAISPARVRRYAWAIGSAFISVSGLLVAPLVGIDVNVMILLYITAFGAAAIGSFTNLPVAFAAAIGIGVFMNVSSAQLAGSTNIVVGQLYTQVPFLVLVLALLLLPGKRFVERGTRQVRRLAPVRPISPAALRAGTAAALVAAVAVPFVVGTENVNQYTTALGFFVVLAALGLVLWTSGQISLCHMAFAGVGASTFAHAQQAGLPWPFAMLCAALVAIPVGMLVAIPSFRLSGIYLAAATFGFGLLFQNLMYSTFLMFGATQTLFVSRPDLPLVDTTSDTGYYFVTLVVAAACVAAIVAVRRSRLGRLLRGLADSPPAMQAHGVDTRVTRLYVFCISAVIAAIGGALIAGVTQSASGSAQGPFGYFVSLVLVAVLAFCGRRPVLSPAVAALVYVVLRIYEPFSNPSVVKYQGVAFGLLAIGVAVLPGITAPRLGRRAAGRERGGPVQARARAASPAMAGQGVAS